MRDYNRWTDEEVELLKENAITIDRLANMLPKHTKGSIIAKCQKLMMVASATNKPLLRTHVSPGNNLCN